MDGGGLISSGPSRSPVAYSYRRFILHQAALCAAAGGVESFCIGSEMRGLTQIRGAGNSFPAVQHLRDLAAEVRAHPGAGCEDRLCRRLVGIFRLSARAMATGFSISIRSGRMTNIDFIGIDNYMPLSDWRDGRITRCGDWGRSTIWVICKANIEGGEGYDWFYHSPEARAAQIAPRSPMRRMASRGSGGSRTSQLVGQSAS